jgi:hypothetical protein
MEVTRIDNGTGTPLALSKLEENKSVTTQEKFHGN